MFSRSKQEEEEPADAAEKKEPVRPWRQAMASPEQLQRREPRFEHPTMLRTSVQSTLSGLNSSSKFSFGKASRFPSASAKCSRQLRSRSSPALSGQTSTTASDAGGLVEDALRQASRDTAHSEGGQAAPGEGGARGLVFELPQSDDEEDDEGSQASPRFARHPPPPREDRLFATRLEGSLDRLGEHKQRAALPRARSYDPAATMGAGASSAFHHAPHFSMGGGPSRMADFDKKKEHLAHITNTTSKKGTGNKKPTAITLMDLKEAVKPRKGKAQASLSRGFGSEARLALKGGPMELPIAPGPGTYDVMRCGDPEPVWLSTGQGPHSAWSKRTSGRPDMKNPTSNPPNIGPGDHVAHHGFNMNPSPSPLFGHPLNEIARPDWPGLEPTRYSLPSTLSKDRSPFYSVGPGQRPDPSKHGPGSGSPGPAHYSPQADLCFHHGAELSFGRSVRQHQCELVDPDEPPGPGAHQVRKDPRPSDKPSAGLPKEAKLRKVTGLGPDTPGPGDVPSTLADKTGRTIGIPLARPVADGPGPGAYSPDDLPTQFTSPSWATMSRTSVRKPPWREVHQPPVFTLKSGEKLIMTNVPIKFKPTGPRWSMRPRREDPRSHEGEGEAMLVSSCHEWPGRAEG